MTSERRTPADLIAFIAERRREALSAAAKHRNIADHHEDAAVAGRNGRYAERLELEAAHFTDVEAALRQAEPPPQGWRDIATAPKDGTVILGHSHMWAEPKPCFWWARRRTWNRHGGPTFWMPMPPAIPPLPAPSLARSSDAGADGPTARAITDVG